MPEILRSYCSWCGNFSEHALIEGNYVSRNEYQCKKCGGATLKCMAPGCFNMARYASEKPEENSVLTGIYEGMANYFRGDFYCGEHDGSVADFDKLNKALPDLADYEEIFKHKCVNFLTASRVGGLALVGGLMLAPAAFLAAPALAAKLGAMGLLGAAGTGTAISTLKGIALINASLAAIGPGGMLGGSICITAAGAALGGATGGMIGNAYYGEIKDFSIKKIQDGRGPAVIFINGFLNADNDLFNDWERGILRKFPDNPLYGVTWESQALKNLAQTPAKAIPALVAKKMLKMPGFLGIALLTSLLPNPWHVAVSKAELTGVLLADLIARVESKDGFILMGHSLGARVIYYVLNALSTKEKQYVKDVYLFGGAVGNAQEDWRKAKEAIEGTVYNFYSANDSVLSYLYRPAQMIAESPFTNPPIGLGRLELGGRLSRNFDVTDQINSHMGYKPKLRELLSLTS